MTATTDSKTVNSKLAATKKKLGKKASETEAPEAAPAPAETPAYRLVDTATCEQTGATYTVGDWVEYVIGDEQMTGQILRMMTQAPPYQTVAEVPNHATGRPWTRELWELASTQAPDADNPFPVSEAQIDAAISGASAPEQAAAPRRFQVGDFVTLDWKGEISLPAVVERLDGPDYIISMRETGKLRRAEAYPQMLSRLALDDFDRTVPLEPGDRVRFCGGNKALVAVPVWTVVVQDGLVEIGAGEKRHRCSVGYLQLLGRANLEQARRDLGLIDEEPADELPVAPELTPVDVVAVPVTALGDALIPGTLGLHSIPLAQLVRSGCNVRRHYDPVAIEELAASLKAEGQIENATGRWNAQGQIEIVAGESRRRAQVLREEAGETGLTLLVNVRELSDADALAISATENMRRRSMTGLEECEAMMRLQDAGRTVEELSAMFGYKSQQPVADRVLVARNLHTGGRDALDSGELSLACAFVIARVAGEDLQQSMTQQATSNYNRATAASLAQQLTRGQFLVKHAKFDVDKSGLEIKRDLFDVFESYFEDKSRAMDAQLAWAKARAERLEVTGKRAFVDVVSDTQTSFSYYSYPKYGYAAKTDPGAGTVLYVSTSTGEYQESKDVCLSVKAATRAEAAASGAPAPTRAMPDSAYLEAHILRGKAARAAIVGNTHLTLALTVWGLILGNNSDLGRVGIGELSGLGAADLIPDKVQAAREALRETLRPAMANSKREVRLAGTGSQGEPPDHRKLLELLVGMTDEQLLGHLNTLTALVAYNWSRYSNTDAPGSEYVYLAGLTGASERLAQDFTLTDEWLKRYPRHEMVALAEEAGLGRALVEDAKTLKEMRGRILEHAEKLHAEGFVPRLLRFPELPGAVKA